jgi:hypothetical protein
MNHTFLNYLFCAVFVLAIAIPINHTTEFFHINIFNFNVTVTDFLFLFLNIFLFFFISINRKSNDYYHRQLFLFTSIFLIFNFFYLVIGLLIYKSTSQSLYDFRPVLYYSIFFIPANISKKLFGLNATLIQNALLVGLTSYSLFSFWILLSPNSMIFEKVLQGDGFVDLGRISFHQEFLYIIAIPLCSHILVSNHYKKAYKFIVLLVLLIFVAKLIIGMSRGLIFSTIVALIYSFKTEFTIQFDTKNLYKIFILINGILFSIALILPFFFENSETISDYFISRFTSFLETNDSSFKDNHIDNRFVMIISGFKEIFNSFLCGHGYGYVFSIDHPEWKSIKISFVDSSYLTITIRSGIVSLFFLFSIWVVIKKYLSRNLIFINNTNKKNALFIKILLRSLPIILFYACFNSFLVFSQSIIIATVLYVFGINLIINYKSNLK